MNAPNRRRLTPFSLSFLDIMSCGFGAVVLLFLIIKHNVDASIAPPASGPDVSSEVNLLEREIRQEREELAELQDRAAAIDQKIATAERMAARAMREIDASAAQAEDLGADSQDAEIDRLKTKVLDLEREVNRIQAKAPATGKDARSFIGQGNREYVSGLKLGGNRILVLLDSSASMLDDTIVNIIRRRNMSDRVKRRSIKWRQAIRIVDWLSARFPVNSQYQIYTFNTGVRAVRQGSRGSWLKVSDKRQLNAIIDSLSEIVPAEGTSLENAFIGAAGLRPLPDNIFLITDSLPTQGRTESKKTTVTGAQRLKFFTGAVKKLPSNIPVNVILSPMEGDPRAASAFWQLAQLTQGSFLSPSGDWP